MVAQDPAAPQLVAAVFGTSVASEHDRLQTPCIAGLRSLHTDGAV